MKQTNKPRIIPFLQITLYICITNAPSSVEHSIQPNSPSVSSKFFRLELQPIQIEFFQ